MTTTNLATLDEQLDQHVDDESIDSDADQEVGGVRRYEISFYGADYPIESLCRRLVLDDEGVSGDIAIPLFQRRYVWSKRQADRFIESILLGLPVPGIFLSVDPDTRALQVIDGLQRLVTLKRFVEKGVALGDTVHEAFVGLTFHTLTQADRRDFENAIIHATVVRQEQPPDDNTSLFHIFERLNTGGTPAQPHEVRRSLFGGPLNQLLEDLDENGDWRAIYGSPSKRLKDQELILRFIALTEEGHRYGEEERTMKDFLTSYMKRHRYMKAHDTERLSGTFTGVVELVNSGLGKSAFRPEGRLNTAVFDAVMVALGHCFAEDALPDREAFCLAYRKLLDDDEFVRATTSRTSHEPNVRSRLELAQDAFT